VSFDRQGLAEAVAAHGRVVRVVVAEVLGSAPREVGAAMLVWPEGQSSTIGGGTLEFKAAAHAREMLARGEARSFRKALLGPDLGQCCGGAVALLSEIWDAARLEGVEDLVARPVGESADVPLTIRRRFADTRNAASDLAPELVDGWFIEPVTIPRTPVWIWGAGHVGRALVAILAPMPDIAITWADTGPDRFPETIPSGLSIRTDPGLAGLVQQAPHDAHHLVLTYSHALDFALCDALLTHGFATAGVIGSDTKWARFRARLRQNGHRDDAIARIASPIGDKRLGKHPQAIAVGVAYRLLRKVAAASAARPAPGYEGDSDDRRALDA